MQELLYISDVLISDYSSCMWDFSLTGRPCFVYAPDIQKYMDEDRSFAYPLEKWPYSIALNNDELVENIRNFDEETYKERIKQHHDDAGIYDRGNASEQVVKIIEEYCNK